MDFTFEILSNLKTKLMDYYLLKFKELATTTVIMCHNY